MCCPNYFDIKLLFAVQNIITCVTYSFRHVSLNISQEMLGTRYLSESNWQMRQIRLHGCTTMIKGTNIPPFSTKQDKGLKAIKCSLNYAFILKSDKVREKHYAESQHDKTDKMICAPSKDSDQPGHPQSSQYAQWLAKDSRFL